VKPEPPQQIFDFGVQQERTSLAWERTSIAMMTAGVILTRYAAGDARSVFVLIGLLQVATGGAILLWTAWHYEELHAPLRDGTGITHPNAVRTVGVATLWFSTATFILATLFTLSRW